MPAPRAHILFSSTNAGSSLLSASPLEIPDTRITVRASESRFPHAGYIRAESHIHAIRSSNLLSRRAFVMGAAEAEKESGRLQEDTGGSFGGVEGGADIILRLGRRFTGGFNGFDSLERGIAERKRKARTVREEEEIEGAIEEEKVRETQSEGSGNIGKP
ncbi:hypothetical protein HOY80DRAFT_1055998 [Tuber brumale]|nr:hypothetical protein HOY80DRAFT_1055998 [Tuber brumale]